VHPVGSVLFSGLQCVERLDHQLNNAVGLERGQRDQLRGCCYDYPECRMIDEVHCYWRSVPTAYLHWAGTTAALAMAEREEVSHLEIYRILIEVKTTLDMALKQRTEDKARDDEEKADIFKRLGALETKMGQVIVLALFLSIAVPVTVELATGKLLHFGSPPATLPAQ
jgi:hypothetical protein